MDMAELNGLFDIHKQCFAAEDPHRPMPGKRRRLLAKDVLP